MDERINAADSFGAGLTCAPKMADTIKPEGIYTVECTGADGQVKWREAIHNTVVTAGKNDLLDKYLAGSAYTAAFYFGLKGTGSVAAGDTMASHAGWTESTAYDEAARPAAAFSAASAGSKATSAASEFTMSGTATIAGAFLTTNSTKGGTTGVLFSAGDFSASRDVVDGDVIKVTYTLNA